MTEQIDITKISDLQLASFSMRADEEFLRAMQNKQMFRVELARREQLAEATAKKVADEMIEKPVKEEPKKE